MQKRTEQEKQEWKRRLSQAAVRERILSEHRERMAEEKLQADLAWSEKKAYFAAQMLAAAQEEKQSCVAVAARLGGARPPERAVLAARVVAFAHLRANATLLLLRYRATGAFVRIYQVVVTEV